MGSTYLDLNYLIRPITIVGNREHKSDSCAVAIITTLKANSGGPPVQLNMWFAP